ncbi:hypothetical protein LEP3755_50850 [Leptolyngbya sp. NIES-3755]|nr:hypothetical protein LEP3755_50850 [Leptolyngbya sp. NIES-3755]
MILRTLRFMTLVLVALWIGLEFSHALALPPSTQDSND